MAVALVTSHALLSPLEGMADSGGAQHQIKRGQFSIATESNGRLASSGQLVFGPLCVDTIVGKAIRNEALDLFIFSK